jgi:hypothetical protein
MFRNHIKNVEWRIKNVECDIDSVRRDIVNVAGKFSMFRSDSLFVWRDIEGGRSAFSVVTWHIASAASLNENFICPDRSIC